MTNLKQSAQAVQAVLDAAGLECRVIELPASTRTAAEAADAIGCTVAQIAKSIVFRAASGNGVVVIASGINRVNEDTIAAQLGEPVGKADAAFVREVTGYAIGGIPPCGHATALTVFLDRDLFELDELWAAAGTPNAVFALTPAQLLQVARGDVISVV